MKLPYLRYWILLLIFLATIINYLDRMTINFMAPVISKKYGLDEPTMALIFNAFVWAYAIGPTVSGWFLDRVGARRGYMISMGVWSAAGVVTAFAMYIGNAISFIPLAVAPIVLGFIVCRFVLGLGESANWPVAIKTISEWFPPKERSFAVGWFNSGSSIGAVIAPGLCTYFVLRKDWPVGLEGWQIGFITVGLLGFIWMLGWLLFYRPLDKHPRLTESEKQYIISEQAKERSEEHGSRVGWLDILKIQPTRGVVMTRFFVDSVWWFYTTWLPTALVKDRGLDLKSVAIYATVSFVASDLGNIVGGSMSSYLMARGWTVNRSRKTVMVPLAILMMTGLAVPFVSLTYAIAIIATIMFCFQAWSVNMMTIPADVVPKRIVASAAGLSHTGSALGAIVMNFVVGYLAKETGGFQIPFLIIGSMPLIGIIFLFLVIGRIAPYQKSGALADT